MSTMYPSGGASSAPVPTASSFSWDSVLKMSPLSEQVQSHLKRVYSFLFAMLAVASVGCVVNFLFDIPYLIMFLVSFGSIMYYSFQPIIQSAYGKRRNSLLMFAFASGASISPLIQAVAELRSEFTVFVALSSTLLVFACFSLSAIFAKRRSYMYLGGWLSSALSTMFWIGLLGALFPNQLSYALQLYGGLLIFSGYVIFDTQLMIEKAYRETKPDVLGDAFNLFADFIALLRRILIIVLRNQETTKKSKRRSDS